MLPRRGQEWGGRLSAAGPNLLTCVTISGCYATCEECTGYNYNECVKCKPGYYFYNRQCLVQCPIHTFQKADVCFAYLDYRVDYYVDDNFDYVVQMKFTAEVNRSIID